MTTETKASAVAATLQPDDLIRIAIKARVMGVVEADTGEDRVMTIKHRGRIYYLVVEADDMAIEPSVSDERIEEILDELNRFIVHEYEGGTEIRMGVAVPVRDVVGSDFNLDKAVDWAIQQREVCCTGGPQDGRASVELTDGTELEFVAAEKSWFVVPAEVEAVQP